MSDVTPPDPEPEWEEFTGKALIASKSPWGTIAGGIIAWLVTHYGFNMDASTCNLLAGAAVILSSYAMRWITSQPITGIFEAAPPKYIKIIRKK